MTARHRRIVGCFLVVTLAWGSMFYWVKIAVASASPFVVADFRLLVGAFTIAAMVALFGRESRSAHSLAALRPWLRPGLVLAIMMAAIPPVLMAQAEREITSGQTAVLNSVAPLFAACAVFLFRGTRDDRPSVGVVASLCCGTIGVALLVRAAPTSEQLTAQLLALFMALLYGTGTVYARVAFRDAPPYAAALLSVTIAAAALLPLAVRDWIAHPPTLASVGAMFVLGVTCTGFAYMCQFVLVHEVGPMRTLTAAYLQPVVALALGVVALGEHVAPSTMAALVLILAAVAGAHGLRPRRARREPYGAQLGGDPLRSTR